jgi:GNAT superfamily N-acetyltransferase
VEIRYARPADAAALAALRAEWGVESGEPDTEAFRATFARWVSEYALTHTAFVADDDGEVVGMAFLADLPRPPSAEVGRRLHGDVQSVYVRADRRGLGLATLLLERVVAEARRRGMTRLTVQSSSRALSLYERAGFEVSPRLMWLEL